MIVLIDNYDSFTYNLVDYFGRISDQEIRVFRNDKIDIPTLVSLNPSYLVISPGPKTPKDAGVSKDAIATFSSKIPILGVCLGHQCIGELYGGQIVGAGKLMHGKTSEISFVEDPLFESIKNPFVATRYHSLVISPESVPDNLKVIAHSLDDNEIMAVKHKSYPIYGVQFHPESVCSPDGLTLLKNFLNCTR